MQRNMWPLSFKNLGFYIQILGNLICVTNFGQVIFIISKHYDAKVFVKQLQDLKKNHTK